MEKFTIKEKILVEDRNLYLIHMPFKQRKKEGDFYETQGRISSYHQHDFNEPDWLVYPSSFPKGYVYITVTGENYTDLEALAFMGLNNGIALTRDNLFMLPALFPEKLLGLHQLHAFMPREYLPEHLNGPKICPLLSMSDRSHPLDPLKVDYDWSHTSDAKNCSFGEKDSFAFFVPILHKNYR